MRRTINLFDLPWTQDAFAHALVVGWYRTRMLSDEELIHYSEEW